MDPIKTAIEGRQILEINYYPGIRLVEPHAYGIGKSGQHLLRAFQVEGASSGGKHVGWKLFRLDRLSSASVLDTVFETNRPDYNPHDSAMCKVIAHV